MSATLFVLLFGLYPIPDKFPAMSVDTFSNFQFDTTSQYGGPALDDAVSVISGFTQQHDGTESLLNDDPNDHKLSSRNRNDEDFDNVLDDFKDGPVDLPPHACRYESDS